MGKSDQPIVFRGYIKKENKHWVAICIDLNIVAQGKTANKAVHECVGLISEYLDYVRTKYPDKMEKYIPRLAPKVLIDEYDKIIGKAFYPKKRTGSKAPYNFLIEPETLAYCYT